MIQPSSGDPCSRLTCGGSLRCYSTRLVAGGRWRQRYFRCNRCGVTAPACQVVEVRSTDLVDRSNAVCPESMCADNNLPMSTQRDYHDWEYFTAFETARWLGVDIADVLARWEDGELCEPASLKPLRWLEPDLAQWVRETNPTWVQWWDSENRRNVE